MELAPDTVIQPAPDLVVRSGTTILIGGYPTRVLSLSPAGGETAKGWFAGRPIGDAQANRRLAWRMVDAGLADLRPRSGSVPDLAVTVVLPVKDDFAGLVATLASLAGGLEGRRPGGETPDTLPVVVVDDGSRRPVDRSEVEAAIGSTAAGRMRITIVRLDTNRGPAAARNHGLTLVETPDVAFVDANVLVTWEQLRRLVVELDEPNTVAVAPRVRPMSPDQQVDRQISTPKTAVSIMDYEQRWSALDMGPRPGIVGPGRPVPYVPSTCLVATVSSVVDAGSFDEDLRYGEDVDLIWRLAQWGWVRYTPSIEVVHPPRSGLPAFAAQRFHYGTAAAPLARRHPRSMAPTRMAPTMAISLLGVLCRSPLVAAAGAGAALSRLQRRMTSVPDPTAESLRLVSRGLRHSALGLTTATVRVWWPILCLVAIVWPPLRSRVLILLVAGLGRRLRTSSLRTAAGDVVLGAIDDGSYALGVWAGACRERDLTAVIPDLHSAQAQQSR